MPNPYAGMSLPVRPRIPTTKWDLLDGVERADADATPSGVADGCSGCGADVSTEGRFARHFILVDLRFWNLGECPDKQAK